MASNSLLEPAFPDFLRRVSFIVVVERNSLSELEFISNDGIAGRNRG